MRSSTSSSESSAALSKLDRALPARPLRASAWIGLFIMIALVSGWEMYWRDYGSVPSYRNSASLWAIERRRIDNGEGDKTVISGSSRMLFNTQPDTWEQESGERPIQLSLEGTSPVGLMEDLAADDDFTGTLLVGVAPGLFFSGFEYRRKAFDRYKNESPTQWIGQQISMLVEPYLAFYHYDFALFQVLERQPFPPRTDVENPIDVRRLTVVGKDRSTRMWDKLETDPEYAAVAQQIWAHGFEPYDELDEEEIEKNLESRAKQIERAVAATNALREKGAEVIFVRNPAEGHYAIREPTYNPRAETWDVLIEKTGALGIHWMDHEALQGFWLPEWSHIAGSEADRYTKALYEVIQTERKLRNAKSAE
jgi:hypothetical protein